MPNDIPTTFYIIIMNPKYIKNEENIEKDFKQTLQVIKKI